MISRTCKSSLASWNRNRAGSEHELIMVGVRDKPDGHGGKTTKQVVFIMTDVKLYPGTRRVM